MRTQIDIIELVKDSFNLLWKYKVLMIFGFIIALFAGGNGSGGFNSSEYIGFSSNSNAFINFTSSVPMEIWIVVVMGVLGLSLILIATGWYLSTISTISIYRAVKFSRNGHGDMIDFRKLFVNANDLSVLSKFFLIDISIFFLILTLVLIPAAGIIFLIAFNAVFVAIFIPLIFCLVLFLIPLFVFAHWVIETTKFLVANYGTDIIEGLEESYEILKREWINYLLLSLANLVVFLVFVPFLVILSIINAVLSLPAGLLLSESTNASMVLFIFSFLVMSILYAIVMSVFHAYSNVAFAKLVEKLKGDYIS